MIKCPLCNQEFESMAEIEKHLSEDHFLSMSEYYEMAKLSGEDSILPLTYLTYSDGYYVPDWDSIKRKYERAQAVKSVQEEIKNFHSKILGDRYFQLFIIDNIYFSNTLPHCYEEFKEVLKILQHQDKKDRNKIWFLDWYPGFPRIISKENIRGIRTVLIDDLFTISSDNSEITVNDYVIKFPEIIPFDRAHHSRYNILNPSIDCRKTKRLRLKNREEVLNTVKFYSNDNEDPNDCKSIFKIFNKDTGELVDLNTINYRDLVVIKLVLLRNKSFLRLVFDIIEEVSNSCGVLSDSIFLRNTITIDPENNLKANIVWTPKEKRNKFINISLL